MPVESTCNAFYFKLSPGRGGAVWLIEFYYELVQGNNYSIFKEDARGDLVGEHSLVEKGLTDKPFTVNAAKVLLLDHLEKIHHEIAKLDQDKEKK
jgi:hypothetical protein